MYTGHLFQMIPLIKNSVDILVELFGERVKTEESFDFLKYVALLKR